MEKEEFDQALEYLKNKFNITESSDQHYFDEKGQRTKYCTSTRHKRDKYSVGIRYSPKQSENTGRKRTKKRC